MAGVLQNRDFTAQTSFHPALRGRCSRSYFSRTYEISCPSQDRRSSRQNSQRGAMALSTDPSPGWTAILKKGRNLDSGGRYRIAGCKRLGLVGIKLYNLDMRGKSRAAYPIQGIQQASVARYAPSSGCSGLWPQATLTFAPEQSFQEAYATSFFPYRVVAKIHCGCGCDRWISNLRRHTAIAGGR